jgi:hypothetical protein
MLTTYLIGGCLLASFKLALHLTESEVNLNNLIGSFIAGLIWPVLLPALLISLFLPGRR